MKIKSVFVLIALCAIMFLGYSEEITSKELENNWAMIKESCKNPRILNNYKFTTRSCLLLGVYQLDVDSFDVFNDKKRISAYFDIVHNDVKKLRFKDYNDFYHELKNLSKGLVNTGISDYESSSRICKEAGMLYLNIFNYNKKNNLFFKKNVFEQVEESISSVCKLQVTNPIPASLLN